MGEALPALEVLEAEKGKDFGELVRERRRQRGLPLSIADKVLPFRAYPPSGTSADASVNNEQVFPTGGPTTPAADTATDRDEPGGEREPRQVRALLAEGRVVEAWGRLAAAEGALSTQRVLDNLERAYRAELATYQRALAREPTREQDTC